MFQLSLSTKITKPKNDIKINLSYEEIFLKTITILVWYLELVIDGKLN